MARRSQAGIATAVVVLCAIASSAVAEAHPGHGVPAAWHFGPAAVAQATPTPVPTPPPPFATGQPFREPPVVRSRKGRLKETLIASNQSITVSNVQVSGAQTYRVGTRTGGVLGPTLQVQPGDLIDLTFDNRLIQPPPGSDEPTPPHHDTCTSHVIGRPQSTNLHFHGLHVSPRNHEVGGVTYYGDNVFACLKRGISHIRFRIPRDHDLGTFWYHAHLHGMTDDQVYRGLAGMLLVGDSRTELPKRLRKVKTRLISLKDLQAEPATGGWSIPADHDWAKTTNRTVNGQVMPALTIRPGETQLWRLANTSSALWYDVALQDPAKSSLALTIVSRDGNRLVRPQRVRDTLLGPGQRVDVLVRAPAVGPLTLRTLPFDQGRLTFPQADLATVQVSGAAAPDLAMPGRRGKLPVFPAKRGPDRDWVFETAAGFTINGETFDPNRVDTVPPPRLGTTERWVLTNASPEWHPIHIHQDDYRVVSVNGKRVDIRSDQDVIALPPQTGPNPGRVELDMPFQQFSGNFVMHCHILDHEDNGMMARIEVRK